MGGMAASRLVRPTPERAVQARALAGDIMCCVLGQDTLLSQCLSPLRCTNGFNTALSKKAPLIMEGLSEGEQVKEGQH